MTHIEIAADADALTHAVAAEFVRIAASAVEARGWCSVALAGGSTPKSVYRVLASPTFVSRMPWDRMGFFFGDERHVPPNHEDSNYGMATENLLSKVPVKAGQIHRMRGEVAAPDVAAKEYEHELQVSFGNGIPRFDLILLGLGTDGHTLSLFPGTSALAEQERLTVANWIPGAGVHRLTMTLPVVNNARIAMFVVSGIAKAEIVRDVLRPDDNAATLPAQLVEPTDGDVWWMLDRLAAHALGDAPS